MTWWTEPSLPPSSTLQACACAARATLEPLLEDVPPLFVCPRCAGVVVLEFKGDALEALATYTARVRLRLAHAFAVPDYLRSREHAHYPHGFL